MPLYVPKSILLFLPSFSFALGANIPFFSPSRILFSLESGHRELRVLKTGYLKTLPVILGQSCPLSADWYGGFCTKIRSLLLLFFFPLLAIFWSWEKDDNFDSLIYNADICAGAIQWVDIKGNPVSVSREWTGNGGLG